MKFTIPRTIIQKWRQLLASITHPALAELKTELAVIFIEEMDKQVQFSQTPDYNEAITKAFIDSLATYCNAKIVKLRSYRSDDALRQILFMLYETRDLLAIYQRQVARQIDTYITSGKLYHHFSKAAQVQEWHRLLRHVDDLLNENPHLSFSEIYKTQGRKIDACFFAYFSAEYLQLFSGEKDAESFINAILPDIRSKTTNKKVEDFIISYLALFGISSHQYRNRGAADIRVLADSSRAIITDELKKTATREEVIPLPDNEDAKKAASDINSSMINAVLFSAKGDQGEIADDFYDSLITFIEHQKKHTFLEQHWISPADLVTENNQSIPLLHFALNCPTPQLLTLLISHFGILIITDMKNLHTLQTPLHYLASHKKEIADIVNFVKLFIVDTYDAFSYLAMQDKKGETFLHALFANQALTDLEIYSALKDIIDRLRVKNQAALELKKLLFYTPNKEGITVFTKAAESGLFQTLRYISFQLPILFQELDIKDQHLLLKQAFFPSTQFSETPLYLTHRSNSLTSYLYLLSIGAGQLLPVGYKNTLPFTEYCAAYISPKFSEFDSNSMTLRAIQESRFPAKYWSELYSASLKSDAVSFLEKRHIMPLILTLDPKVFLADPKSVAKVQVLNQITTLQTQLNAWNDYLAYLQENQLNVGYKLQTAMHVFIRKYMLNTPFYALFGTTTSLIALSLSFAFASLKVVDQDVMQLFFENLTAVYIMTCDTYGGDAYPELTSYKERRDFTVLEDCCNNNSTCLALAEPLHKEYFKVLNDVLGLGTTYICFYVLAPVFAVLITLMAFYLAYLSVEQMQSAEKLIAQRLQAHLLDIFSKLNAFAGVVKQSGFDTASGDSNFTDLAEALDFIKPFLAKYKMDIENLSSDEVLYQITLPTALPAAPTKALVTSSWLNRATSRNDLSENNERTALLGSQKTKNSRGSYQ